MTSEMKLVWWAFSSPLETLIWTQSQSGVLDVKVNTCLMIFYLFYYSAQRTWWQKCGCGWEAAMWYMRPATSCLMSLTEVTYDKYLMICNEPEIYIFNKNVNSFVFTMWLWVPPPGHLSGCVGNSLATIGYSYMPIYLAIVFELSYAKKTTSHTIVMAILPTCLRVTELKMLAGYLLFMLIVSYFHYFH